MIERGHAWYVEAHTIARDMATEHLVPIEVSAGILAALSRRMPWARNVLLTERMLSSLGTLDHGCLSRSLEQARAIYGGADPDRVLRGLKTNAFHHAIVTAGESQIAVIDTHAWSMLTGVRTAPPPNRGQYRLAADMMTRGSRRVGVGLHEFQATTWLAWRSRFWRPGTNDHHPQLTLEGAEQW